MAVVVLAVLATAPVPAQGVAPAAGGLDFTLQARTLGGMRAQAASLLVQGGRAGSISLEILAAPVAPVADGGGTWTVPLLVEIEGPSLLAANAEAERLEVEIYAYAIGAKGSVAGFLTQQVALGLEGLGESLYASGLKLVGSLRLPPGRHSLRVLVMEAETGAYGLRTLDIEVPEPGAERSALLAALVPEPAQSWLLLRQDTKPPRRRGGAVAIPEAEPPSGPPPVEPEEAVAPLLSGPATTLPAAMPVLDAGSSVEVHLLGYHLPDEVEVTAHLEPEGGTTGGDGQPLTARTLSVEVLARLGTAIPGLERLSGRLQVPALPTSAFHLRFEAAPAAGSRGKKAATEPLRLIVLEHNPLPGRVVWGRLRSLATAVERGAGSVGELDLPRRGKKRVSALERTARQYYAEALDRFAGGATVTEVVAAVAQLEDELATADPHAYEAVPQAELAAARELAGRQAEALVPLIGLHLEVYRVHRRERRFALATAARTVAREMAILYAATVDNDSARGISSEALTALGWDLLEAGLRGSGEEALTLALELNPDNRAARLLLGAYYEKTGAYRRAAEMLQELVAADPKSAEGRLRLALTLGRLGDTAASRRQLQSLITENNPPWTLTVAYSELAAGYLSEDRVDDAGTLLRQALDRLPGQECLVIQLAFTLDRQRRSVAAREVLRQLDDRGTGGSASSPRHRYTEWPQEGLVEAREAVSRSSAARMPLLSGALAEGPLTGDEKGS